MSRKIVFMLRQSLIKVRSFYIAAEYSCVATEIGLGWGFYEATECYYTVTKSSRT